MRCMKRNKQTFYYASYDGRQPMIDEYGNTTGEYVIHRKKPCAFRGNVSAARGETEARQFGENLAYDKVIVLDNTAPPIDEYTVFWIDTVPEVDAEGELTRTDGGEIKTPHDYIVKKIARSLNHLSVAISKVNVRG